MLPDMLAFKLVLNIYRNGHQFYLLMNVKSKSETSVIEWNHLFHKNIIQVKYILAT